MRADLLGLPAGQEHAESAGALARRTVRPSRCSRCRAASPAPAASRRRRTWRTTRASQSELTLAPGQEQLTPAADLDRRSRAQGDQDAHLPSRPLRRRRRLSDRQWQQLAPGDSRSTRRSCATTCRSSAPISTRAPTPTRARRSTTVPSSRSSTCRRMPTLDQTVRGGVSGRAAAVFRGCDRAAGDETLPLHAADARATSFCSRPQGPTQTVAAGATAERARHGIRRAEAAVAARSGAAAARSGHRLRHADRASPSRCSGCCRQRARLSRQLGLRDHHRDSADQAAVLPIVGGERALDGEDAGAGAAA